MRPQTRERVLSVMREEGYTPNAFARGLGLNTMQMVGLLCTDISDTFYAKAASLIESDLRRKGFDSLLCCTGNSLEDKKKYLELLLAKHVDAVILTGSAFKESTDNSHIENAAKQAPVIIINGLVELPNVYCVLCDEASAMRENVRLLTAQGHKKILYLYDTLTYSGRVKLEGYRSGLAQSGLAVDGSLIVKVPKELETAVNIVGDLLDGGAGFTSVIASEDLLAVAALKALQARSLQMPIIGFNNSVLAECSSPALSSVDNRLDVLCPTAVDLLTSLLEGNQAPQKTMIPATLVQRETFRG